MKEINKVLKSENLLLKQQLEDAQNYILGFNSGLRLASTADMENVEIFCDEESALSVIMQILKPADKCLQLGGLSQLVSITPLYGICAYVSPHIREASSNPLLAHSISICMNEIDFLKRIPRNEIDTVFILDNLQCRSSEEESILLKEAFRVANTQVVVSNYFLDILNDTLKLNYINQPKKLSENISWGAADFGLASKVRFKVDEDEYFCAIISVENQNIIVNKRSTSRLVLLTDLNVKNLEFYPNDLVMGDISLISSFEGRVPNFRPMFLSVLAKNLNLPNYQLRQLIANYDLLEGYYEAHEDIVAYGREAEIILKYFLNLKPK